MLNPCIQCGKERIDGKTWKEKLGNSVIVHTKTVCPDSACQKLVDQAIEDRKEKNSQLLKKKQDAKEAREKMLSAN